MDKKLIYRFFAFLVLLGLSSCGDDVFADRMISAEGLQPVEFEFILPDDMIGTRAPDRPKRLFVEGDVIHIEAFFSVRGEENSGIYEYGAMVFNGGKFVPVEGSMLLWPYTVDYGKFRAFFVPGSTGSLRVPSELGPFELSELNARLDSDGNLLEDTDPLMAESVTFEWGHVVQLQFEHACTYLSIENMDPGVTDEYRFYKEDLQTAYRLVLSDEKRLSLEFVEGGTSYIARPAVNYAADGEVRTKAGFFLAPGDYSSFQLLTNNDYGYLSFNTDETKELQRNWPYILDVQKSQGVVINKTDEDKWDEEGDYEDIDVPTFLAAIANESDYTNDSGKQILRKTYNGTELLCNVDFKNYDKYEELDFDPNVNTGSVFDGGYHFIRNIGHPVFRYNYGMIKNVGFNDIKSTVVSDEQNEQISGEKDSSRQGGICCWNRSGATIQNVRVKNVSITVQILTTNSQETHNAGCLVGSNTGTMYEISVSGEFALNVVNHAETANMDATVNIGGFVGQNVGVISGINPLDGDGLSSFNVKNSCHGEVGVYWMGGAVGFNSSTINHVIIPEIEVDSSESTGTGAYIGGLAGRLASDSGTSGSAILSNSMVGGTVKGANSYKNNDNAHSYTGGIAGGVSQVSVIDCQSVCDVHGPTNKEEGVTYATGGALGRILIPLEIENITAYGTILTGPSDYIGDFVGILPEGESWDDNYSGKNIVVRQIVNKNVGGNLNP